jgi:hypothetical protein
MTTLQFDGLTFDDAANSGLILHSWEGWWEGPPIRSSTSPRNQADGDFGSVRNWRGSRPVTVEAGYIGAAMSDTRAMIRRLAAMQASGVPSPFRVTDADGSLQSVMALVAPPVPPKQLGVPRFDFSFDVVGYDPLLYGDPVVTTTGVPVSAGGLVWPLGSGSGYIDFGAASSSGRATTANPGSAATLPLLEVTGGLSLGFVIADVMTGSYIRVDRVVPLGSTVFINQRTGRITIDAPGNDIGQFVTRRDLLPVPAGATRQFQLSPLGAVTGTPILTVRTSPAYL